MQEFLRLRAVCQNYGILFVDDERSALDSVGAALAKIFKNVFLASSPKEALEIFETNKELIHIVMSDIVFDGSTDSGLDLVRQMREKDESKKFIIASGYDSNEYLSNAIRLGVTSFLLKPMSQNDLFASLGQAASSVAKDMLIKEHIESLRAAKEQLQNMVEKQDRFIKDAIHELGTPLSVIMSAKDLIAIEHGGGVHLDNIEAACRSLQNSFEDMSYLMKKDNSEFVAKKSDICDFVRKRVDFFAPVALANRLKIDYVNNAGAFYFDIPDVKLQKVIDNNLSNAIKYSSRDCEIVVSTENLGDALVLSFQNKGKQIIDVDKIFERFYREDDVKGGYGIGLALTGEICKEHGIKIEVSSGIEGDTTFKYTFGAKSQKERTDG